MKKDLLKDKVEQGLNEIRPFLESDGGNIELISIEKNVVKVKLLKYPFLLYSLINIYNFFNLRCEFFDC